MNCPNCDTPMGAVFDDGNERQVDSGLMVEAYGYYGGFFDQFLSDPRYVATICHDCAVRLLAEFPVFAGLLSGFAGRGHPGDGCCGYSW